MRASARAPRSRTAPWCAAVFLLIGVSGWWASPAHAESLDVVTFSGGCGAEPGSMPDVPEVSVPAESELGFLNDVGLSVVLRLNGVDAARVKPGDAAVVRFHDGPVEVTMDPGCLREEPSDAVTVSVFQAEGPGSGSPTSPRSPATTSPSASDPAPSTAPPTTPSGSTAPSASSVGPTGSTPTRVAPSRTEAGGERGPLPSGTQPVDRSPTGIGAPSGPAERAGPAPTSTHRGDPADMSAFDRPGSVDGGGLPPDPVTVDGLATVVDSERDLSSGSLSRTIKPVGDQFGLLALIATVCVLGVSAAVVRAIIAQRANRVEWA